MNLFACALLAVCTQDPGQALLHYEAGDFVAAAEAFRAATTARPDAADLWYDLALAEWRAGKLPAAEDAAERYASTPGGGRVDLHRGLLGNIRYSEAAALGQQAEAPPQPPPAAGAAPAPPADPVALLEQAVAKAKAARDEFVRAAAAPAAGAEVARNTERALKLLADLEKKLEEAKKRRDEQQQDQKNDQKNQDKNDKDKNDKSDKDKQDKNDQKDQQDQKNEQQKDQQKQNDDKQQQNQQQKDQQKDQQPKDGEARPEPKLPDPKEQQDQQQKDQQAQQKDQQQQDQHQQLQPKDPQAKDGEARPQPKPEDGKDGKEPKPAPPRSDAPGEQLQATELTPEQKQRLLEELQQLDGELRKIRAAARVGKKPVERDW